MFDFYLTKNSYSWNSNFPQNIKDSNKLALIYIVNETDNKLIQIDETKKKRKRKRKGTLGIIGGNSQGEATQNKEIVKNIKVATDHKNKSLRKKVLILGDWIVKEIDGLILVDSIVKGIDGWRLRTQIKGTVTVKLSATTKEMFHHTKDCIADCTPSIAILHHETNYVAAASFPTEISDNIISQASDTTKNVNEVIELALTIPHDKWDLKRKKVNEKLKKQCDY